jgi:hypothetical protein
MDTGAEESVTRMNEEGINTGVVVCGERCRGIGRWKTKKK